MVKKTNSQIIIENSLQSYFFEKLSKLNDALANKLPMETVYYSSYVLNKYSLSEDFFEIVDNKVSEKVLGRMLLESQQVDKNQRREVLKEVGDTTLCLMGVFSDSINNKILDESYYVNLGVTAYDQLNSLNPSYMDIPDFYKKLSTSFRDVVRILTIFTDDFFDKEKRYLLFNKVS